MKINTSVLRQLYQEHLQESQIQSRKKCPPPETLLKYSRRKFSKGKRTKITDHIGRCTFCALEFKFIQEILTQEQSLNLKFAENLAPKDIKTRTGAMFKAMNFIQINRRIVIMLATSLLLITSAVVFFLRLSVNRDYRGDQSLHIKPISPIEKQYPLSKLHFRWSEIPSADYYMLEIYNDELYLIWKSGKLLSNSFIPSPEQLAHFEPNITYFWMVKASFPDGKKIESPLHTFTVGK